MKYISTFLLIGLTQGIYAQFDSLYMAIIPFNSQTADGINYAESVRSHVYSFLSNDHRFVLVERDEFDAVVREREYQKSEDFIDGKIVEQGKAIGARFLLGGFYNVQTNSLSFSIYDVANGSLKCSIVADKARTENERGLVKIITKLDQLNEKLDRIDPFSTSRNAPPQRPSQYVVETNIRQLMKECFPYLQFWSVVRPLEESSGKVKELLIAAGSRMRIKKGTIVEVLVWEELTVDGITTQRMESAGWGRITRVEGENFSNLKLEAGGKNVKRLLKEGKKLKCRYVKK